MNTVKEFIFSDPRKTQIILMGTLLMLGAFARDFSIRLEQVLLTFASGILTQMFFLRVFKIKERGYLSAVITCLGISLLYRNHSLWVHPAVTCTVMSAKFLLRVRGKHIFNPGMLAVILGIKLFPGGWVSPAQWGDDLSVVLILTGFGFWVSRRARIQDIAASFIFSYMFFLLYRTFYYGYSFSVFLHQISNGSLILFTFFMITDPRTAPDSGKARILHGFLVALLAYNLQFALYMKTSLIWSLFFLSFLVPLWDRIFKGSQYIWNNEFKGDNNEKIFQKDCSADSHPVGVTVRSV
ncbi:MAG TPA: RnfABCDGE type electron transport complex subunit D [Leptospiraceae bacterium]|nr:RnfABCDGE type electron transport complex subunit D [Leptospiraceae bacterium]